jgi:hypothetical protein
MADEVVWVGGTRVQIADAGVVRQAVRTRAMGLADIIKPIATVVKQ